MYSKKHKIGAGSVYKNLQNKWWILTIIATLLGCGYYASEHLSNEFVQKEHYKNYKNEQILAHNKIDLKIENLSKILIEIRIDQVRSSEREKLIDAKIELLLQNNEAIDERVESQLKTAIKEQERILNRIETDPRFKKIMLQDHLSKLN